MGPKEYKYFMLFNASKNIQCPLGFATLDKAAALA